MKKPLRHTPRHVEPETPKAEKHGLLPARKGISWAVIRVAKADEGTLTKLTADLKPGEYMDCDLTQIPESILANAAHNYECAGVFRALEDYTLGVALGYRP